jgi:hypothetical protein
MHMPADPSYPHGISDNIIPKLLRLNGRFIRPIALRQIAFIILRCHRRLTFKTSARPFTRMRMTINVHYTYVSSICTYIYIFEGMS